MWKPYRVERWHGRAELLCWLTSLLASFSWNQLESQDSYSSCRHLLLITILATILLPFLYTLHGRFSRRGKELIIETLLCRRLFAIQMCSPSPPSIFYPSASTGEHSVSVLRRSSHTPHSHCLIFGNFSGSGPNFTCNSEHTASRFSSTQSPCHLHWASLDHVDSETKCSGLFGELAMQPVPMPQSSAGSQCQSVFLLSLSTFLWYII